MAALPQQIEIDGDGWDLAPIASVFRVRPAANPPSYYRNRPLIRLRCPQPPQLPARPSDPPQIRLVAPIPGLDGLDAGSAEDLDGDGLDGDRFEGDRFEGDRFEGEGLDGEGLDGEFEPDGEPVAPDDLLDELYVAAPDDEYEEPEDRLALDDDDDPDEDDLADADDWLDDESFDDGAFDDESFDDGDPLDSGADDSGAEDTDADDRVAHDRVADDTAALDAEDDVVGKHRAVAAATAQPAGRAARPATQPVRPPARPRRDRATVLLTLLIVVVLVALGVTGVLLRRNLSAPTSRPAAAPPGPVGLTETNQAVLWITGNLPTTTTVATDASTRNLLIAQGISPIRITDITGVGRHSGYAVVTPSVRAAGSGAGSPLATLLAEALPVAVFGDGQARVEVSQLGAMDTSLTTAQQARLLAGRALQRNPGLHIVTGLAGPVADGRVDMRAETLLAVLANQLSTALLTLPQTAAEARAGAPIRSIGIQLIGDPATADKLLGSTIRMLPPAMAPYQTSRQPDGGYRIVWLPDLALTPPVN